MAADSDQLWFDVPSDATTIDVGGECAPRIEQLAALTTSLDMGQRRRLAITQEMLVRMLRQVHVRYAGHLVRRSDERAPRLSVALLYAATTPADCGSVRVLEAISARMGSGGGQREAGMVELPAGRALAVAETVLLGAGGRVWHGRVMLPHRNRRCVVTVGITTPCIDDWRAYAGLVGVAAHSITFDGRESSVAAPEPGPSSCRIAAALGGSGASP